MIPMRVVDISGYQSATSPASASGVGAMPSVPAA
jgi:hypothetical protein